jgi:hypothetical protein
MQWLHEQLATSGSPVRWGLFIARIACLLAGFWLATRIESRIRSRLGRGPTWRELLRDAHTRRLRRCVFGLAAAYLVFALAPAVAAMLRQA